MADVEGYKGIVVSCQLPEGSLQKGIFGWKVEDNVAESTAQNGNISSCLRLHISTTSQLK